MNLLRPLFLITSVLSAASVTLPAHAETVDCTLITSVPYTITTQGIYCLTGNLATSQSSGNAITITANNVTLDLNGWKVGGQAAGTGTSATGIHSTANNVTIKNGIVRGFQYGVYLTGRGALVQDMLVDQSTILGIYVYGQGAVVEHNQVVDTGGSTSSANVAVAGIEADGSGAMVTNNVVSGLTATGTGNEWGIFAAGANSTLRDNVVSDIAKPTGGGTSYGINGQAVSIAVNNVVSNFDYGIYYAVIYAHNTVSYCTTNYSGGIAGAGNSP